MRVAATAICLNEERFVDRFMRSAREADGVYVLDTGSTDGTVDRLRELGATVHLGTIQPWRFDTARNAALRMVPEDYDVCVSFDLDEVFTSGWANALKQSWSSQEGIHRLRYPYVWSTLADGSDGITLWSDKIFARQGFHWTRPVHEVLAFDNGVELQGYCDTFKLTHQPDPKKSRAAYLPLLELAVSEDLNDDRSSHYLGREYMFRERWDDAIVELKRHLSLPSATWDAERAASMRFIGKCYGHKGDASEAYRWLLRACAEATMEREPWVDLGGICYQRGDHLGCYHAMIRALEIKERPMTYICDPSAWGSLPFDLAGISAYYLGLYRESVELSAQAIKLSPHEERLLENFKLILEKVT